MPIFVLTLDWLGYIVCTQNDLDVADTLVS
jgi:hypothetical protein